MGKDAADRGWSVQDVEREDAGERYTDFHMLGANGKPAACIRPARGGNASRPAVWLLHLPVGDLEESLRRVPQGGGQVVIAAAGTDDEPAYAVVQDPVGVSLALVQS